MKSPCFLRVFSGLAMSTDGIFACWLHIMRCEIAVDITCVV